MANAKQRRALRRALDRCVSAALGWTDGDPRIARRFRESRGFWKLVGRCAAASRGDSDDCHECGAYVGAAGYCRVCAGDDDDWQDDDQWDDEDRDEDDDVLGCWEGGKFRRGLCPDDLCHGANRCMAKPRPWEGCDESSVEVDNGR